MENELKLRITEFKKELSQQPVNTMVRKYITFGDSFVLDNDKYFNIKTEVAEHFSIHPSEVLIVGSAKTGFSIAKDKRYRAFCDESDIDLAIISPLLFDEIWKQVFDYWNNGGDWWPSKEEDFKEYLFRGWIRPDKLPHSENFTINKDWWEFFRELTSKGKYGPYSIRAGLYKTWSFFESYQSICVSQCKQDLELPIREK